MYEDPHIEKHFSGKEFVRDVVIGMSDGLTVPFALAAGLSGAIVATHIIVTAGLAEIAAGSIAMGLGGFLAAKGDVEHYDIEEKREYYEIEHLIHREEHETSEIFESYGLTKEQIEPIISHFKSKPKEWVDFMMRFELGLEKVDPHRALKSARNIALSYIVGGFIPLSPYMIFASSTVAFMCSVAATLIALFIFGFVKGHYTGNNPWKSAAYTTIVGGLAAAAAFSIARLI